MTTALALRFMNAPFSVRTFGDPVLRRVASEVTDIDGRLVRLADDMLVTMYAEPGIGLAAPQVGVQRRLFVYDIGDGPQAIVNPEITESEGEWGYIEGCLSVPGLSWEIVRPKQVHVTGRDLNGNEVSLEADDLLGRLIQHELDHLDGVLLIDHLEVDVRRAALRTLRERYVDDMLPGAGVAAAPGESGGAGGGLRLP